MTLASALRWGVRWLLTLAVLLTACGETAPTTIEPVESPQRTAVQDQATRALMANLALHRACSTLLDRFVPLPEDRRNVRRRVTEGRLWVNSCRAERTDAGLSLHLEGRGWQWVERTGAGPFGSSFNVRGTVRLEATLDVSSELDMRYEEDDRRVLLAMTPTSSPRARVTPIGAIPVAPAGGWSSIVGGLGGLLGVSPQARARPLLEEQAALLIERELAGGATLSVDLCTSQLDLMLGAVGDDETVEPPPYPGEAPWIVNSRVQLHERGLDMSGPWDTEGGNLHIDVEVESGGPVEVSVLCQAEAAIVASSFLAGGSARSSSPISQQTMRRGASVLLRAEDCAHPHVMMTSDGEATVRYRIRREGLAPEALVDCD